MGFFSWKDCKDDSKRLKVGGEGYLLIPKEFGGGHIKVSYYNGYGEFGGLDVYELVYEWNRKYLSKEQKAALRGLEKREKGIELACYDEDNAQLHYPIKISLDSSAVYEECEASKRDEMQGCD